MRFTITGVLKNISSFTYLPSLETASAFFCRNRHPSSLSMHKGLDECSRR